ncbi:uncharacterized protein DMAD_11164 [Drosophila madeirensis]|uniref:Secreted protein n=1 Tax=Drosophila madeirensis TaxID=30013 RepID=A0AAU9FC70_DROMD
MMAKSIHHTTRYVTILLNCLVLDAYTFTLFHTRKITGLQQMDHELQFLKDTCLAISFGIRVSQYQYTETQ